MTEEQLLPNSPLTLQDIQKIEATKLSSLEKHYLRILAHCLVTFQTISQGINAGPLPNKDKQLEWVLQQPKIREDSVFIKVLLDQFATAAFQLEKVGKEFAITPLELTLNHLIHSTEALDHLNDPHS